MTRNWPKIDPPTARRKNLLEKKPMEKMDFVWDRAANALNMLKNTKQVNVIVVSLL